MSRIPDDLISIIFLLLPTKTLVRFRALSKPISSLIESVEFTRHHLTHSLKTRSNLRVILRDWNLYTLDFDSLVSNAHVAAAEPFEHPLHTGGGTEAVGSCHGLLVLRNSERVLVLYNPSTRRYKRLPVSEIEPPDNSMKTGYVFYGFGYDSVNEDYKLVRMATFVGDDDCEFIQHDYEVKVYSLKNDKWKKIKGLPFYLRFLHKPFYQVLHRRGYGVYACNSLHWAMPQWLEIGVRNSIVAFDIVGEEFREVYQPDYEESRRNYQVDVGVLEGKLCLMCNHQQEFVDLWIMEEYGVKESWRKVFSFRSAKPLMFLRPLSYSKDGRKALLEVNDQKLVWFDWKKRSVRSVKIRGGPSSFGSEMCVGSLVQIGDGESEEREKREAEEIEKAKAKDKKRDDFLSVGFKLKL
ncbi:F-box protein CPR1 [Euphorbia peplus]|nr:F-box protein CPR1 [Euphorbia peplus]